MSKIYFLFFSGVFACNCVWTFDQPIVCLTSGIVAFLMYSVAWRLDGREI